MKYIVLTKFMTEALMTEGYRSVIEKTTLGLGTQSVT